jgi:hypothetical protein
MANRPSIYSTRTGALGEKAPWMVKLEDEIGLYAGLTVLTIDDEAKFVDYVTSDDWNGLPLLVFDAECGDQCHPDEVLAVVIPGADAVRAAEQFIGAWM